MLKNLILLFLSIAFIGCVKIEDIPEGSNEARVPIVESTGDWNRFRVKIPITSNVVSVQRSLSKAPKIFQVLRFQTEGEYFIDHEPPSGESVEYSLVRRDGDQSEVSEIFRVDVPMDLMVESLVEIQSDTKWVLNRLILKPNGILQTNGYKLWLMAQSLESENALIRTFPSGAQAKSGRGRSGSHIEISANQAQGSMRLELRGQQGANGKDGGLRSPAMAGTGPNGKNSRKSLVGHGCQGVSTNGGPGQDGLRGLRGQNGFDGGDSGSAFIFVRSGSLSINELFDPGMGGQGGSGGIGQKGGNGGMGGAQCLGPRMPDGDRGRDGSDGDPGDSGESGRKETVCIQNAKQKKICR